MVKSFECVVWKVSLTRCPETFPDSNWLLPWWWPTKSHLWSWNASVNVRLSLQREWIFSEKTTRPGVTGPLYLMVRTMIRRLDWRPTSASLSRCHTASCVDSAWSSTSCSSQSFSVRIKVVLWWRKRQTITSFYCLGSQKTFRRKTFQNTQLCLVFSEVFHESLYTFYYFICIIPVPSIIKLSSLLEIDTGATLELLHNSWLQGRGPIGTPGTCLSWTWWSPACWPQFSASRPPCSSVSALASGAWGWPPARSSPPSRVSLTTTTTTTTTTQQHLYTRSHTMKKARKKALRECEILFTA